MAATEASSIQIQLPMPKRRASKAVWSLNTPLTTV